MAVVAGGGAPTPAMIGTFFFLFYIDKLIIVFTSSDNTLRIDIRCNDYGVGSTSNGNS